MNRIAEINDRFRATLNQELGKVIITRSVNELPLGTKIRLANAVTEYSQFNDIDPHDEHDFGQIQMNGESYYWRIDYYDKDFQYGTYDPGNLSITKRVLTIMHRDDYQSFDACPALFEIAGLFTSEYSTI
jgi:Protein of unknown function (DUF3768)